MDTLEGIRQGLTNNKFSVEDIYQACLDGIKRHYGASDLIFYRGYKTSHGSDAYGHVAYLITGSVMEGDTWMCSTEHHDTYPEIKDPGSLKYLLDDFYRGKVKVYFVDTEREYDCLDDLRHDHLAVKLSGVSIIKKKIGDWHEHW